MSSSSNIERLFAGLPTFSFFSVSKNETPFSEETRKRLQKVWGKSLSSDQKEWGAHIGLMIELFLGHLTWEGSGEDSLDSLFTKVKDWRQASSVEKALHKAIKIVSQNVSSYFQVIKGREKTGIGTKDGWIELNTNEDFQKYLRWLQKCYKAHDVVEYS